MKQLLFTICWTLLLSSCTIYKTVIHHYYEAEYEIGLTQVEAPANAKIQYGDTKITQGMVQNDSIMLTSYLYEDDYIRSTWSVANSRFSMKLENKSDNAIQLLWDNVSFVDIDGQASKVVHSGIKYSEKDASMVATTIPQGAVLKDIIIPAKNINRVGREWQEKALLPVTFDSESQLLTSADFYTGKTMKLLLPIEIEGTRNDYTFEFRINKVKPKIWSNTVQEEDVERSKRANILLTIGGGIVGALIASLPLLLIL